MKTNEELNNRKELTEDDLKNVTGGNLTHEFVAALLLGAVTYNYFPDGAIPETIILVCPNCGDWRGLVKEAYDAAYDTDEIKCFFCQNNYKKIEWGIYKK
ncbi:MAG: hypothetical protein Q4E33_05165 [Erysipelotrichaceae bacterium]|nr:hypothetical protein [Erysipelotrichaceae bacterium]